MSSGRATVSSVASGGRRYGAISIISGFGADLTPDVASGFLRKRGIRVPRLYELLDESKLFFQFLELQL